MGQCAVSVVERSNDCCPSPLVCSSPSTNQLHEGVKPTLGELEKFQVTPEEMEQECERGS